MEALKKLFEAWAGIPCTECLMLNGGGSSRKYYRLVSSGEIKPPTSNRPLTTKTVIGCISTDLRENEAFFSFTRHLHSAGMPVPELYAVSDDGCCYLQQDLGDQTLYNILYEKKRHGGGFDAEMMTLYRQALSDLDALQKAGRDLDFSKAYPRAAFDRRSMLWDLNYFKYFFLKLAHIQFDEQLLEDDFQRLMDYLLDEDCSFFMYRDFQGRNIMLDEQHNMTFIDFQGGRRGSLQYDVASLLYSSKSDLPDAVRNDLLQYYIDIAEPVIVSHGGTREGFRQRYYAYALLRLMQAMGAYGYRGYCERKDYFLKSIPLAANNIRSIIDNKPLGIHLPHLYKVLHSLCDSALVVCPEPSAAPSSQLTVRVCSFSYRNGIPADNSGNGGGHVFDCRALPNPGRCPEYRSMTGMDAPVIEYMRQHDEVDEFLDNVQKIVFQSVRKYVDRNFSNLMVSFGCTGG